MMNKQEKEDQFEWWITCIPDKIALLKKRLPEDVSGKLDQSIESLDILEKYLLDHFKVDTMKEDKEMWDCCASYISRAYKKSIPSSQWYIELENESDVFFNVPILRIINKLTFEPHSYVTTLLDRKKGNLLSTTIRKHIKYLEGQ
jgi:hypothetical protein